MANKYVDYHTKKFGYSKPNVNFVKGDIEKLREAGLKDNSFDIIVLVPYKYSRKINSMKKFRCLRNNIHYNVEKLYIFWTLSCQKSVVISQLTALS